MQTSYFQTTLVGCCAALSCLSFCFLPVQHNKQTLRTITEHDLPVKPRQDWGHFFKELNFDGTFVLYDVQKDEYAAYQPELAFKKHLPASTFKIFNSLVALETGVVPNEQTVFKWDGIVRDLSVWNRDLSMDSAFKYSAVWYYQELARRIGRENMENWLIKADYGNKLSGKMIDQFWLNGKLRISPVQQVDFIKRLYFNTLPFSKRSMDIVKKMMLHEKKDKYAIHGKTGFITRDSDDGKKTAVGWFVGFVSTNEKTYIFAICLEEDNLVNPDLFLNSRIDITKKILKSSGIIY